MGDQNRRQFLEVVLAGGAGIVLSGCATRSHNLSDQNKEPYDFSDLKEVLGDRWNKVGYTKTQKSREIFGEYNVGDYNRAADFITKTYKTNLNGDVNRAKDKIESWQSSELRRYKTMLPWINFENPSPKDALVIERLEVMEQIL